MECLQNNQLRILSRFSPISLPLEQWGRSGRKALFLCVHIALWSSSEKKILKANLQYIRLMLTQETFLLTRKQKKLLTKKPLLKILEKHSQEQGQRWGRSSVWLERLPVTQKAASSSLVAPAINYGRLIRRPFSLS